MKIKTTGNIFNFLKEAIENSEDTLYGHKYSCSIPWKPSTFLPETITTQHLQEVIEIEESDADKAYELVDKVWKKGEARNKEIKEDLKRCATTNWKKRPHPYINEVIDTATRELTYNKHRKNQHKICKDFNEAYKEEREVYSIVRYLLQPFTTQRYLEEVKRVNDKHLKAVETLLEGVKDIRELKLEDLPNRTDEDGILI